MDLTIIGFIIAVVGIVLQVADAFPEHRETRKAVVLLALGVFIGIVASALLGAKYQITGDVDRRFVLLYVLAGLGGLFALTAVMIPDEKRRDVASSTAGVFAALFLVSGFAISLGTISRPDQYSTDEILLLANSAEQRGQYETAIDRLEQLRGRLNAQAAQDVIQKRIDRLQAAQSGIGLVAPK